MCARNGRLSPPIFFFWRCFARFYLLNDFKGQTGIFCGRLEIFFEAMIRGTLGEKQKMIDGNLKARSEARGQ